MKYVLNILIGIDTLFNALFGGSPYETISLRAAIARDAGSRWGCVFCKVLDSFERRHCDGVKSKARLAALRLMGHIDP